MDFYRSVDWTASKMVGSKEGREANRKAGSSLAVNVYILAFACMIKQPEYQ